MTAPRCQIDGDASPDIPVVPAHQKPNTRILQSMLIQIQPAGCDCAQLDDGYSCLSKWLPCVSVCCCVCTVCIVPECVTMPHWRWRICFHIHVCYCMCVFLCFGVFGLCDCSGDWCWMCMTGVYADGWLQLHWYKCSEKQDFSQWGTVIKKILAVYIRIQFR